MPRIVFLDIDGTLVTYENVLPDSAVAAIHAARTNGHRVYLTTGRSRAEIYEHLWDIGLDGLIGGNGSYVEDAGEVLLHQTISRDDCRAIVDWLHGRGCEFYLEGKDGLFGSENFLAAAVPVIRQYAAGKGKPGAATMQVPDVFP